METANPWDYCTRLANEHYENFTVGSRLLPRRLRFHMWAVYAYCRTVDDLGDEAPGDRLALLDQWEKELYRCFHGTPRHPVMQALQTTVRTFDIPIEPFLHLIEANRQDQRVHRYATFDELLNYCRFSANPVGRIVLRLLNHDTPENVRLSDATCTALQLTNFWQDVARDWLENRLYIPLEDMERFSFRESDLHLRPPSPSFRDLIRFQVERTRQWFDRGDALIPLISGRFRIDIALFSMGGRTILDGIEAQNYDVLTRRPVLSRRAKTRLLWKALWHYAPWRNVS